MPSTGLGPRDTWRTQATTPAREREGQRVPSLSCLCGGDLKDGSCGRRGWLEQRPLALTLCCVSTMPPLLLVLQAPTPPETWEGLLGPSPLPQLQSFPVVLFCPHGTCP